MLTHTPPADNGRPPERAAAGHGGPAFTADQILPLVPRIRDPLHVVRRAADGAVGLALDTDAGAAVGSGRCHLLGTLPPLYPEWLGDRSFCAAHGVRFGYVAGEMANGIATVAQVTAMARAGMLGFFGAAGLGPPAVERAVAELSAALHGGSNWGVNLIHSPTEPELEERVAALLLHHRVPAVSASAYMALTPAVVRCSASGLHTAPDGSVRRRTRVLAKVSRPETAEQFMSPAPAALLRALVRRGDLTEQEARLAERVPVADDVTVEADSGGHTDNRPLVAMLPAVLRLRDELTARHRYPAPVRVGAAGGLGTPAAVAAAFGMGAAYVVTGSVNQSAVEAGVSDDAKALLAEADVADVTMAPAADMFEMGVNVQVLRRGIAFPGRAARLYRLYRDHDGLDDLPPAERERLERTVLHASLDEVWAATQRFWQEREPAQLDRAEHDPKHRMALVFRWYLGLSSRWAIEGTTDRRTDYQLWCGPAMGAFNRWTKGSFLAEPAHRTVVQIALNLLEGAAVLTRVQQLRACGVAVPPAAHDVRPRLLA
ncbi:PfaD family polyunsaturated fatty acid/polyketide biosynthesis protein [Spirillospora sp. NPDC127200]